MLTLRLRTPDRLLSETGAECGVLLGSAGSLLVERRQRLSFAAFELLTWGALAAVPATLIGCLPEAQRIVQPLVLEGIGASSSQWVLFYSPSFVALGSVLTLDVAIGARYRSLRDERRRAESVQNMEVGLGRLGRLGEL